VVQKGCQCNTLWGFWFVLFKKNKEESNPLFPLFFLEADLVQLQRVHVGIPEGNGSDWIVDLGWGTDEIESTPDVEDFIDGGIGNSLQPGRVLDVDEWMPSGSSLEDVGLVDWVLSTRDLVGLALVNVIVDISER